MVGTSQGGLTFDLADRGGGVYTVLVRPRDLGTFLSCCASVRASHAVNGAWNWWGWASGWMVSV